MKRQNGIIFKGKNRTKFSFITKNLSHSFENFLTIGGTPSSTQALYCRLFFFLKSAYLKKNFNIIQN